MEIDFKSELSHLGFSDTESGVYLALLELGSTTNSKIARKAGLNRITTFEVLKRLTQKGIVSGFKIKGVMYFGALNPQILIKQQRDSLELLEKGLAELLQNKADYGRPKFTTFSTKQGLKQIYEESLLSKGEVCMFSDQKEVSDYFGNDYIDNYKRQLEKKGIKVKELGLGNETGNSIIIFDDTVATISFGDEKGILIRSQLIAKSFRAMWGALEERNQKPNA